MTMINRRVMLALAASLAAAPALAQEAAAPATDAPAPEVKDFSTGSADAPIKIVEYASFTCPHCANFHSTVFKQLKIGRAHV